MTSTRTVTRLAARLTAVASVATVLAAASVALAGSASADVPQGWPDTDPVEPLHVIAVLVGIPLALFVIIVLFVYVPALVRGEDVTPGGSVPEDQWLGGPRKAAGELAAPDTEESAAGGAGARW